MSIQHYVRADRPASRASSQPGCKKLLACAILAALTGTATAETFRWASGLATGDWNTPASWGGLQVPDAGDTAVFSIPNATEATMAADTTNTVAALQFTDSPGGVTLNFAPTALLKCTGNLTMDAATVRLTGSALEVSTEPRIGNSNTGNATLLIADDSTFTFANNTSCVIGYGASSHSNTLAFLDSDVDILRCNALILGYGNGGSSYNTLALTNATLTLTNTANYAGEIRVGQNANNAFNDILLDNSTLRLRRLILGENGKTNSLVMTDSTLIQTDNNGVLTIGNNAPASHNSIRLTRSSITTSQEPAIGGSGTGNTLVLADNSTLTFSVVKNFPIGLQSSSSNNTMTILDSVVDLERCNLFHVGYNGSYNTFAMTNATLIHTNTSVTSDFRVGHGGEHNQALLNNSTLFVRKLVVGEAGKFGRFVADDSDIIVAGGGFVVGNNAAARDNRADLSACSLVVTNSNLTVGGNGTGNLLVLDKNTSLTVSAEPRVGDGNSIGNTFIIAGGSTLTLTNNNANIIIGLGGNSHSNTLTIVDTDVDPLRCNIFALGYGDNSCYNTLALTNATLTLTNATVNAGELRVGWKLNSAYNAVLLDNSTLHVRRLVVGQDGSKTNTLAVDNAQITVDTDLILGNNVNSVGNSVTIQGANALVQANAISLNNDAALTIEIPVGKFEQPPIQGNRLTVSPAVTLSIEAKEIGRKSGGRVPLAFSADGSGLDDLLAAATFATTEGRLAIEDGGTLLVAYIPGNNATLIMLK